MCDFTHSSTTQPREVPADTYRMRVMSAAMRWVCVGFVLAALAAACTKKNPILVCQNGQCTDSQYRYCDVDGAIGGEPNTCVKPECSANQFVTCDGSNAITCNSDANDYTSTACEFGCSMANNGCNQCAANSATCSGSAVTTCDASGVLHTEQCTGTCVNGPTPHCEYLSPKYLPDVCDTPGSGTLNWTQSGDLDSDLDVNCTGGVVQQAGGNAICVLRYSSISIADGATLHVISSVDRDINTSHPDTGRAIAFVSDGDLVVAGTIDISAQALLSGPGGGLTRSGGTVAAGQGGGGAGFATAGGNGGSTTTDGGANNGGQQALDPATLVTLVGGPRSAGGGGGAAVLISCRGSVKVPGWLIASGGGGPGGYHILSGTLPGGGGGAGGYMVLEGLNVVVTGSVWAKGGGGGAGGIGTAGSSTNEDGHDGSYGSVAAPGGYARTGAGNGGDGGWANRSPQPGLHPSGSGGPGGGGGSMGFFQSYTPAGVTPTITPAEASPAFQPNATIPTR